MTYAIKDDWRPVNLRQNIQQHSKEDIEPAIATQKSRQTADLARLSKDTRAGTHTKETTRASTQSSPRIHQVLQDSQPALLLARHEERHCTDDRRLQGLPGKQAKQGSQHHDTVRSFERRAANGRGGYGPLSHKRQGLASDGRPLLRIR